MYYLLLLILGISKKSRSLFMELDANAVKTKQAAPISSTKKEYIPIKQVYNSKFTSNCILVSFNETSNQHLLSLL